MIFQNLKISVKNHFLKQRLKKQGKIVDFKNLKIKPNSVLIIDSLIPEFNKDSGSRRLFELIKLMLASDRDVFLMADLKEYKYRSDYIQAFKDQGVHVYEPCLDEQNTLITKKRFIEKIGPQVQFAWLHRPIVFDKYYSVVKKSNQNCKCIYDMVDFHYLRLIREYELNKDNSLKAEAEVFLKMEIGNCNKADIIIAISQYDKTALQEHYSDDSKIEVIGNVHQFIEKPTDFPSFKDRSGVLFLGSFRHPPNKDAVLFLKNDIMPLVWNKNPEIEVVIVGSYAPQEILDLNSDKFVVKGFVNDLTECFKHSRLFIAPLRYGAGIKGKIGQSFEWSLPLVTTDVGIEGFDVSPYYDDMIANTAELFASKILELYENEDLWNKVSSHSETILKPFSLDDINRTLRTVLN